MRIIIAGSRDFNDYDFLHDQCDAVLMDYVFRKLVDIWFWDVEIVSGNAKGADQLGERYAKERDLKIKLFPANWEAYGKSAGYKRNMEMANYAKQDNGALLAFWDGKSKGTKHMIDVANKTGLKVAVYKYNEKQILS
jgi:hypothetical protein